MNTLSALRFRFALLSIAGVIAQSALAQSSLGVPVAVQDADADAAQTARILGLDSRISELRALRAQRPADGKPTFEEILIRQELLESIQIAILDVDGVLAELSNERGQLGDLRSSLQSRRDRTVSRLNAAALITGSGLGVAVNATQFSTLSNRTQDIGDGIGVGSGVASTILSVLAVRRQHGPNGSVGETPNMLGPLLGGTYPRVLSTYYPPPVLHYLRSIPASEDSKRGTRLEQLMEEWVRAGRLDASDPAKRQQKITVLSTSMDTKGKLSIDDLTDRIAMLTDVSGRVSLMKRDLAVLMRSYMNKPKE